MRLFDAWRQRACERARNVSQRPRTATHTTAQHALADEQRNTTAQHSDSGSSSSSSTRQERHSTTANQASRGVSRQTCCLRLRRATCPKRARKQQNRQTVACTRSAGKADANNTERHVQHSKWVGGLGSGRSLRTCVCMEFWPWPRKEIIFDMLRPRCRCSRRGGCL